MTTRLKIIVALLLLVAAFASGRYSVSPPKVDKTTEVDTHNDTKTDTDRHKKITIVKNKDGSSVTTITDDAQTQTDKSQDISKKTELVVTPQKVGTLNVSALASFNYKNTFQPVYGVSVTKQIAGPLTAGAFGLANGTIGVSIGLNF